MVAPVLTDLMLTVQLPPQMPVQALVVKMLMSNQMSATPKVRKYHRYHSNSRKDFNTVDCN